MVGCYVCLGCGLVYSFSLFVGLHVGSDFGVYILRPGCGRVIDWLGWFVGLNVGSGLDCIPYARGVWAGFGLPVDILWFCFGLMPLSYIFRGGAVRLSFSLVASALYYSCLFVGFALLEINS